MARKSKLTVLCDRLKSISKCPYDLFDKIEADDILFDKIEKAEKGDTAAISEISAFVFDTYKYEVCDNHAMLYFLCMGIGVSDLSSAERLIWCAAKRSFGFELFEKAVNLIGKPQDEKTNSLIEEARIKKAISDAEHDPEKLYEIVSIVPEKQQPYFELYIIGKIKPDNQSSREYALKLCHDTGMPRLAHLPSFGSIGEKIDLAPKDVDKEKDLILSLLTAIEMTEWRDFSLKVIYEYCTEYLESDFTYFAPYIFRAIQRSGDGIRNKMYMLAWLKYAIDRNATSMLENVEEKYARLREDCIISGCLPDIDNEDVLSALLTESISDWAKTRINESNRLALGNEIIHTKNRYAICCLFENHAKRGNRHMWETTISMETDKDTPPEFRNITISERRNSVTRCGVTLEPAKGMSQVICTGELVSGKVYPLELDLILDISYVSTTKCANVCIKAKDTHRNGKHLIMRCLVYIS